eukprot:m.9934 g.9934  ORF g.9934 m.9934 type:complete len:146 (+) comp2468_c0_seq1:16-453(+)
MAAPSSAPAALDPAQGAVEWVMNAFKMKTSWDGVFADELKEMQLEVLINTESVDEMKTYILNDRWAQAVYKKLHPAAPQPAAAAPALGEFQCETLMETRSTQLFFILFREISVALSLSCLTFLELSCNMLLTCSTDCAGRLTRSL